MLFSSIKEISRLLERINRLYQAKKCQIFTKEILLKKSDVLKTSIF